MKILVTGNMGYLGSVVVPYLAKSSGRGGLVGLDTGFFAHDLVATQNLPEIFIDKQYFGDIRDFPLEALRDADAVVHLAALSNDPMGALSPSLTHAINLNASLRMAQAAKGAGVARFVFASSCSVYGLGDDTPRIEGDKTGPLTAYAHSKLDLERELQKIAAPDFQVIALRFATACGFSPRFRTDLVLNQFTLGGVYDGRIDIKSDGSPWRPLIHVQDMARAVDWALDAVLSSDFLAINTGSNAWNYQVQQLALEVNKVTQAEIFINPSAAVDNRSYRVDFSLFSKLAPAHQPTHSLRDAIEEMVGEIERMVDLSLPNIRPVERLKSIQLLMESGKLDSDLRWVVK